MRLESFVTPANRSTAVKRCCSAKVLMSVS
jgi:hypothetical protein